MLRGMLPAFKKDGDKNLLALLAASTIAIGLFYGTGLFYGERTHITIMERSEEHTSELQSLMRISYAVFCLKKKKSTTTTKMHKHNTYMPSNILQAYNNY